MGAEAWNELVERSGLGETQTRGAPSTSARALLELARKRARCRAALLELGGRVWEVTGGRYAAMNAEERRAFDAARQGLLWSDGVVRTEHVEELDNELASVLARPPRWLRGGVLAMGAAGHGKTTAIEHVLTTRIAEAYRCALGDAWWGHDLSQMQRAYTNAHKDRMRAVRVDVVPVSMPSTPTPRALTLALLGSLASAAEGLEYADAKPLVTRGVQEHHLTQQFVERAEIHGVQMIVMDELHFVRRDSMGDKLVNHFKALANQTTAAFVMAGVTKVRGANPMVREGTASPTDEQLSRRFTTVDFEPFTYERHSGSVTSSDGSEWKSAVRLLSSRLKLLELDPAWWVEENTLEYLWLRTGGVFADLVRLIERAGSRAIGKAETLTIPDLEPIRLSDAADFAAAFHKIGPSARKMQSRAKAQRSSRTTKAGKEIAERVVRSVGRTGDPVVITEGGGLA